MNFEERPCAYFHMFTILLVSRAEHGCMHAEGGKGDACWRTQGSVKSDDVCGQRRARQAKMSALGISEGQNMSRFASAGGTRAAVQYGEVRHDGIWCVEGERGGGRVCTRLTKVSGGNLVSGSSHDCSCC